MFFASLQSEWPGYLPVSADLWRVAGAHCSHCFKKDGAIVLAAFERAEVAGRGVIFFRPLIEVMQEQAEKIRSKKARADFRISTVPQISTKSGHPSLSLDLDFKEKKDDEKNPLTPCEFCQNTGVRHFKPPRKGEFWCHCPIGVKGMAKEHAFAATGD